MTLTLKILTILAILVISSLVSGCWRKPEEYGTSRFILVHVSDLPGEPKIMVYRDTKSGREYLLTKYGNSGGLYLMPEISLEKK